MDIPEGESLDGSSIKPVSSLRSHFEQMAGSKPNNAFTHKAISPQPTGSSMRNGSHEIVRPDSVRPEDGDFRDVIRAARGREEEASDNGLRPLRTSSVNMSPSPSRIIRPRPVSTLPPAVTVQPPMSPPRANPLNLVLPSTPAYLSADSPMSASSGNSPKHFRIPSRSNTPILDPGRSPRLSSSQPPSPPPPRRSGEYRREAPVKPSPPPVNRADKPKIASKPMSLAFRTEATTLEPAPHPTDRSSPFNTPPSSGSSPEHELPPPALPRMRPLSTAEPLRVAQKFFEPPPVHHSVITKRNYQDTNGLNRALSFSHDKEEDKPALPARPQAVPESKKILGFQSSINSMGPPPRPSMDRSRPPTAAISIPEHAPSYATPPKRVFSTPTSSLQTPPRTHGRSMTVDRTSDRTPAEFRAPAAQMETRQSLETAPMDSFIQETITPNLGEHPDPTRSNRRPPYFMKNIKEIPTGYDTRIMDVCGEYVCTSGIVTRVWSLVDGTMISSFGNPEGVKITSVGFKPMADVADEGLRLWLGNNVGELAEVDVQTTSLISSKVNAHTRRDVIKIYRHLTQMWTLDDGGALHVWAPDSSGAPNLGNPTQSFRVPKGHTFSMVVGHELWHATGKELRIFIPTVDGSTQFQLLQRPLIQPNTGDITSGAIIESVPDKVYIGHTDGKVSIYSLEDYSCLGVINVSVYKITSLVGVGGLLWASFSPGTVYIYDTTKTPWLVKKDWQAHHDPVVKLVADQSSCWSMERTQVVSLGQDKMLRVWDGLLNDDWIENQMQSSEAHFCKLTPMKALVMTWNAGASTPSHLRQQDDDARFFQDLLGSSGDPDIVVFGFQELVDLEDKTLVTKSLFSKKNKTKKKDPEPGHENMSHQYRDWKDHLKKCMDQLIPSGELYYPLHTATMVGLFTCIFVKASLRERIRGLSAVDIKRGMGGKYGNKGALVIRFVLDDTSMCFINCHLAAGQTQTKDRNADITAILESHVLPVERDHSVRQDSYVGGGDGSMVMDHEICILNGDLNYRIDTMGRDTVVSAVKARNLAKLLERDQLLASRRRNPWFKLRAFNELPISFPPTYKYDVGTDNYDTSEKKRAPAWCDRILYRGRDRVKQLDYRHHPVRVSDHRPVTASFEIIVKTMSPEKREAKWAQCQEELAQRKQSLAYEARQYYLSSILGFDAATAKKMITKKEKAEKTKGR